MIDTFIAPITVLRPHCYNFAQPLLTVSAEQYENKLSEYPEFYSV